MTLLARIADRVINRPLLLDPQKAEVVLWVLGERIGIEAPKPLPEGNRFIGEPKRVGGARGYGVQNGAAVITIEGSLVNRGEWIGADSGLVSYEGIEAQLMAALGDANVSSIVLDLDSPGGEATGMYALASKIRSARQVKPVIALVNDLAASAAYGLASQADEILVSPTSVVGSIGVVLLHLDRSKQYANAGISPTLIFAGAHKVDGNPFGPLSDAVKEDLQREVMTFYDRFIETVVAGRAGRLTDADARATEARTFIGADAINVGLADAIGGLAEAIAAGAGLADQRKNSTGDALPGRPSGNRTLPAPGAGQKKESAMDWNSITADSLRQNRPDLVQAIENALDITAKLDAARGEGEKAGKVAGATAERERLAGIDKIMPAGMEKLAAELKADAAITPEKAAVRFLEAQNALGERRLQSLRDADKLAQVPAAPAQAGGQGEQQAQMAQTEDGWKAEFAKGGTGFESEADYLAFKKAEARGGVKILEGRTTKAA